MTAELCGPLDDFQGLDPLSKQNVLPPWPALQVKAYPSASIWGGGVSDSDILAYSRIFFAYSSRVAYVRCRGQARAAKDK